MSVRNLLWSSYAWNLDYRLPVVFLFVFNYILKRYANTPVAISAVVLKIIFLSLSESEDIRIPVFPFLGTGYLYCHIKLLDSLVYIQHYDFS